MHVTHSDWHNFIWVVITGFIKLIIIKIKVAVPVTDIAWVILSRPFLWYHLIPTYYAKPCNICVAVCYKNWWIGKELNIRKEWLPVQRNKDIWITVQQNCVLGFIITLVLFSITWMTYSDPASWPARTWKEPTGKIWSFFKLTK